LDKPVIIVWRRPALRKVALLRVVTHIGDGEHSDRWLIWQRQRFSRAVHDRLLDGFRPRRPPQQECLDRTRNVLQVEQPQWLEGQIQPIVHMVAHRSGDADATRRTLCLKPPCDNNTVPMQISPIGDSIANVDTHTEADGMIW
jgi:hypothetical protein